MNPDAAAVVRLIPLGMEELMKPIRFENAYYIKLGRHGEWEESSIPKGLLRIGWGGQRLKDINEGNWSVIRRQLRGNTRAFNGLKRICESTEKDIWITFYRLRLWWCRVGKQRLYGDGISKYRKLSLRWRDRDIQGNSLESEQLPGTLSKIRGYRGAVCRVKEIEDLRRLLNHQPSREYERIRHARESLVRHVQQGVRKLHWKDFEILVDLVFRGSGWRRLSRLGEAMKGVDLELEDPITHDNFKVQIKSKASLAEFDRFKRDFAGKGCHKLFFVCHSPKDSLLKAKRGQRQVELLLPERLAEMVVDLGLTDWLMNRIR